MAPCNRLTAFDLQAHVAVREREELTVQEEGNDKVASEPTCPPRSQYQPLIKFCSVPNCYCEGGTTRCVESLNLSLQQLLQPQIQTLQPCKRSERIVVAKVRSTIVHTEGKVGVGAVRQ